MYILLSGKNGTEEEMAIISYNYKTKIRSVRERIFTLCFTLSFNLAKQKDSMTNILNGY